MGLAQMRAHQLAMAFGALALVVLKDALLQPQSRERYAKLLKMGWVDAIRTLHPDEPIYTFWDYFRKHWERDAGLRIDHLLLNPAAAARLKDSGVHRWVRGLPKPSDHAPTWVKLVGGASAPKPKSRQPTTSAARKHRQPRG